jgi:2-amino-4-hydroxy-6-hydroxymethyldihydropteridine diphosphokinase
VSRAFVGVGSNVDPAHNMREAVRRLAIAETVVAISTVYRTAPERRPEQGWYYNCVVQIRTATPPAALKHDVLRRIERELGRTRSADRYAERTIDLDLVWYDDLVVASSELTLPDPEIARRPYLAICLCELAPGLQMPGSGFPLSDTPAFRDRSAIEPLVSYTDAIRSETVGPGAGGTRPATQS